MPRRAGSRCSLTDPSIAATVRPMALRARLYLLLAALLVIICLLMGGAYLSTRARDRVDRLMSEVYEPARYDTSKLLNGYLEMQDDVREYAVTDLPAAHSSYQQLVTRTDQEERVLRRELAGHPPLTAELDGLDQATATWLRVVADPVMNGRVTEKFRPPTGVFTSPAAISPFAAIQRSAGRLDSAIAAKLTAARGQLAATQRRLWVALGLSILAIVVTGIALLMALEEWITLPIESLLRAVRRVSGGDLGHEVASPGPPELSELGSAIDRMRRAVIAEAEEGLRARQALAQGGLAVLTLSAELGPSSVTLPPNVQMAAEIRPVEGILAGDWYDVVVRADGVICLVSADVSGHGAVAGILALRFKQLMLLALRSDIEPGAALCRVAEGMGDTGDNFLTCVVIDLEPATGRVRYASAGHPEPLCFAGTEVRALSPTGPLLGPIEATWATEAFTLAPHDLLVTFTDGIVEARNDQGEEYGVDRLIETIRRHRTEPLPTLTEACFRAVADFTHTSASDDQTLVLLTRTDPDGAAEA